MVVQKEDSHESISFLGNILSCILGGFVAFGLVGSYHYLLQPSVIPIVGGIIHGFVSRFGVGGLYGQISNRGMKKLLNKQD